MRVLLPALFLPLAACDVVSPKFCTDNIVPGVVLNLREAVTGGPVLTDSLLAIAREGAFADSVVLRFTSLTHVAAITLADERAGVYALSLEARGYEPWTMTNVRVEDDDEGCHVVPAEFDVELEGER